MAAAEARLFTFPRNADVIQSQSMPQVTPGWVNITSRHWDLPSSPSVPHFDQKAPEFPAGVDAANSPQAREYYAYAEKLAPFWPSAIAMFLAVELKKSVGDEKRFAKYKAMIEEGLKAGDFAV
ncbi:uncharacterized protein BKCO1_960006 [Diplodia corticola]|uniref:Uncharacterized protein n=1 Tax=Diplodia corticola TaxID=236234 RepID=A0A1J9R9E2_9PEZI|nr:uncharacterized protein BKCO1_960006 [Diplodia corticola]OJD29043.1 hypothetical protein BKCO1_960006 [Diplodia corticola]